jgi:ABC-type polysaccharide/polyol phosphate transport system ATPase subunit
MNAIEVDGVTKSYRAGVGRARIREALPWPVDRAVSGLFPKWWSKNTFDALADVTLTVPTGSSIGVVGHNGAGKTTLLKVISGVTSPTLGTARTQGRVAALLDVLVGFHPELTGTENALLLGSMQGFSRRTVSSKMAKILEFAEIAEHADTPVKRYSAGMTARLAFGIFASLEVDILLVDEVLVVGDSAFQRKCIDWLDDFRAGGGTLLFVSHNLSLIRGMTERAVWFDHGRLIADDATDIVLTKYATAMEHRDFMPVTGRDFKQRVRKYAQSHGTSRWGAGGARVEEVHVENAGVVAAELNVRVTFQAKDLSKARVCVGFVDERGTHLGAAVSPEVGIQDGRGAVVCSINPLPLRSGIYFPIVAIVSPDGLVQDHWMLDRAVVVERNGAWPDSEGFGPVEIHGSWTDASKSGA